MLLFIMDKKNYVNAVTLSNYSPCRLISDFSSHLNSSLTNLPSLPTLYPISSFFLFPLHTQYDVIGKQHAPRGYTANFVFISPLFLMMNNNNICHTTTFAIILYGKCKGLGKIFHVGLIPLRLCPLILHCFLCGFSLIDKNPTVSLLNH